MERKLLRGVRMTHKEFVLLRFVFFLKLCKAANNHRTSAVRSVGAEWVLEGVGFCGAGGNACVCCLKF